MSAPRLRGASRRLLLAPLLLALAALAAAPGAAPAQGTTVAVPVPAPQAGRGAGARADAAGDADASAAARLTEGALRGAGAPVQGPPPPTAAEAASAAGVRVYLMTIGQGDAVWERFGHNALWVHDPARGTDLAYNWGMFDFAQPNFLGRFLTGDTQYWMEPFDARSLAAHYGTVERRRVIVQELALTDAQKASVRAFVQWNAQEANRYYRYDYYLDNCSTRVRDAIDRALGGVVRDALRGVPTSTSYRSHTRRLMAGDVPTYTGIQLALGRPADAPIDAWQESFLPTRLMAHLARVRVPVAGADPRPLVLRTDTLFAVPERAPERAAPPSYAFGYGAAGLALGAALLALGRAGAAGRRGADAAFAVLAGLWTLLAGLAGTALLLAGTVTRHVFMGRNENLLAVNPVALLLFVLLLLAVGFRKAAPRARWGGRAAIVAAVLAACTLLGAVLSAIPGLGQRSTELFALLLPVHGALWWALRGRRAAA